MDNRIYISNLYDYYGILLTDKQQAYFEEYYFNNLSLAEIAENYEISRNAVHKQIKETEEKLHYFEEKLQLYHKGKQIKQLIQNLDPALQDQIIDWI